MNFNLSKYNRYVTFQTPTDVNTKGSPSVTWADTFSTYASKREMSGDSGEENGKRTTLSKSTWSFPYNSAIVKDGRFYEANDTSTYYVVVNVSEVIYQTELLIEAELKV